MASATLSGSLQRTAARVGGRREARGGATRVRVTRSGSIVRQNLLYRTRLPPPPSLLGVRHRSRYSLTPPATLLGQKYSLGALNLARGSWRRPRPGHVTEIETSKHPETNKTQ
eukprot:scaffold262175_cov27-Tisochrysis_lutea.AAC.1